MLKLIIAGMTSIFLLTFLGVMHEDDLPLLMNLPSILFAFVIPLIFTIAHHSLQSLWAAIHSGLGHQELDPQTSLKHRSVISTLRLCISGGGIVGFLVGLVNMLANMDDPTKIGPAMAVATLSALYAVILSELFVAPLINRLNQNTGESEEAHPPVSKISPLSLVVIPFSITSLFVLLLSFTSFSR